MVFHHGPLMNSWPLPHQWWVGLVAFSSLFFSVDICQGKQQKNFANCHIKRWRFVLAILAARKEALWFAKPRQRRCLLLSKNAVTAWWEKKKSYSVLTAMWSVNFLGQCIKVSSSVSFHPWLHEMNQKKSKVHVWTHWLDYWLLFFLIQLHAV